MLKPAFAACKDRKSLVYSTLATVAGTNHYHSGHNEKAANIYSEVLAIRQALLPSTHEEIANAKHRLALACLGANRIPEAFEFLEEAIRIDLTKSPDEQLKGNTEFRYRNRARAYIAVGEFGKARSDVAVAAGFVQRKHPPGSYYEGS
jgi:tetratricopeptide (TPR) repeat protein